MLNLKEFRTGNLLKGTNLNYLFYAIDAKYPHQIWIQNNKEEQPSWSYNEDLYPIRLTEELLLNFGFVKEDFMASGCEIYQLGSWRLAKMVQPIKRDSFSLWHENMSPPTLRLASIRYVHQLQNLFFSLTGVELELSSNVA